MDLSKLLRRLLSRADKSTPSQVELRVRRLEARRLFSTLVGISGDFLTIADTAGTQDDDLTIQVSADGASIVISDPNQILNTSIAGATGDGTNQITIQISDLAAANVSGIQVDLAGGDDRLILDLSVQPDSLLSQFHDLQYDSGTGSDSFVAIGDGGLVADVTIDSTVANSTVLDLLRDDGTGTKFIHAVFEDGDSSGKVSLSDFAIARYSVVGDVDQLTLQNSVDIHNGGLDALKTSGNLGANDFLDVSFHNVDSLQVRTFSGPYATQFDILNADNNHGVNFLSVHLGTGNDQVNLIGDAHFEGGANFDTYSYSQSGILSSSGGDFSIDARGDVEILDDIKSNGGSIVVSANNGITIGTNASLITSVTGGDSGSVLLINRGLGDIDIAGLIDTSGTSDVAGNGTKGGIVRVIASNGAVFVNDIIADGGDAAALSNGSGGDGGRIAIRTGGSSLLGDRSIHLAGQIRTIGGNGDGTGSSGQRGAFDGISTGHIIQANIGATITSGVMLLSADGDIGPAGTAIRVDANKLDLASKTGSIFATDIAGGVDITDVNSDGFGASAFGGGVIRANSPLTISSHVSFGASASLIAGDNTATAGDDLVIRNGAVVKISSAISGQVLTLQAGDDVRFEDSSIASTTGGIHSIHVHADHEGDLGIGDGDGGTISQVVSGATSLKTQHLQLNASNGIGTLGSPLTFDTTDVISDTSGNSGTQHLKDIANGLAIVSMKAGGGDIRLLVSSGGVTDGTLADLSPNISARNLLIDSAAGIGGSGTNDLDVQVDQIALAANGAIFIDEVDAITVGTVFGVSGVTSGVGGGAGGAISIIAAGNLLTVSDVSSHSGTGGTISIHKGTIQGAVKAGAGDIILQGGNTDLLVQGNVTGTGNISLSSDRDIHIDNNVSSDGGQILLDAANDVDVDAVLNSSGGDIFVLADGDIRSTSSALIQSASSTTDAGDIVIRSVVSGSIQLDGVIDAQGGTNGVGAGQSGGAVRIETIDGSILVGTLLANGGSAAIGSNQSGGDGGRITVKSGGNFALGDKSVRISNLVSTVGGTGDGLGVRGTRGGVEIISADQVLRTTALGQVSGGAIRILAERNVGTAVDDFHIDGVRLDVVSNLSDLYITDNQDGLELVDLTTDGKAVSALGGGFVKANSPLLVSSDVLFGASAALIAGNNTSIAGDDLVIQNGANVRLISAVPNQTLTLQAGDDVRFLDSSLASTGGANHLLKIVADAEGDLGVADGAGGHISQTVVGAISAKTARLELIASNGIGSLASKFTFDGVELSTDSSGNNGSQYLRDVASGLALATVNAGTGDVGIRVENGNLTDATSVDASPNVTAQSLLIDVNGSIGGVGLADIDLQVTHIAVRAAGDVELNEVDGINVGTVFGVTGIQSGVGVPTGGNISLIANGNLIVNQDVTSLGGTGGDITIRNANIQANVTAGAGNVLLQGANANLVLNGDVSGANDITLESDGDIIVSDLLSSTSGIISLHADIDANGLGGVWIQSNGEVTSGGGVSILGSDLIVTALPVDSVRIDADGINNQITSSGNIFIGPTLAAPANADVIIRGFIQSTASGAIDISASQNIRLEGNLRSFGGDITLHDAVVLTDALDVESNAGQIHFQSTIDDDGLVLTSSNLTAKSNLSNVYFEDSIGGNQRISSLVAEAGTVIQLEGDQYFTVGEQRYLSDVELLSSVELSTVGNDIIFFETVTGTSQTLLVSNGVDDLRLLGLFDLGSLIQVGGTGTTFLSGGEAHDTVDLATRRIELDNSDLLVATSGSGDLALTAQDSVVLHRNVNAIGGTVTILANQDGIGADGFLQDSGRAIITTSTSASAIKIAVDGDGHAQVSKLVADGVSGGITIVVSGGAIFDNNGNAVNIVASEASLTAFTGIANSDELEVEVERIAARTDTGDITLVDLTGDLTVTTVGTLNGVSIQNSLATSDHDVSIKTFGQLTISEQVRNSGAGAIFLDGSGIHLSGSQADVTGADEGITLDANTGELRLDAGASVVTRHEIVYVADRMQLDGGSLTKTISPTGTVQIYTDSLGTTIGLGDSAAGVLQLSTSEVNSIESAIVRIGSFAPPAFASATTGQIQISDLTVDADFATNFLALTTFAGVAGGGTIDFGASQSDIAIRALNDIDLDVAPGLKNFDRIAITTRGSAASINVNDNFDGMTVADVDGVNGIETGDGSISLTAIGRDSDLLIEAPISNTGSFDIQLSADDCIRFSTLGDVTAFGDGNISILANRDGLSGDGITAGGQTSDSIHFSQLGADRTEIGTQGGKVLLSTKHALGTGGDIRVGGIFTTNSSNDAITILTDRAVIDAGDGLGIDLQASAGGLVVQSRHGFGSGNAIEIAVDRLEMSNSGLGATGNIEFKEKDDLRIVGINQQADNVFGDVTGSLIVAGLVQSDELIDFEVGGSIEDSLVSPAIDMRSRQIVLNAGTGIGEANQLEIRASELTAVTATGDIDIESQTIGDLVVQNLQTGSGDIELTQLGIGGLQVLSAVTPDGNIRLVNDRGDLAATFVQSGVNKAVDLVTVVVGDVLVDQVHGGVRVDIDSADRIVELGGDAGADISADTIQLLADTGVGEILGGQTIEFDTADLKAVVSGDGDIRLRSVGLGGVDVNLVVGGVGDVLLTTQTEVLNVTNIETNDGNVQIVDRGFSVNVDRIVVGGGKDVSIQTQMDGDVRLDLVSALDGTITIQSAGTLVEKNSDIVNDLVADDLVISAANGIGITETIEANVERAEFHVGRGGVDIRNQGALKLEDLSGGIGGAGASVTAGGGDVLITTTGRFEILDRVSNFGGGSTQFEIDGNGTMLVGAAIQNSGGSGDLILTAGASANSDLIVLDSVPYPQSELSVTGNGVIRGNAGGDVTFKRINDVVFVTTATGSADSVAPIVQLFGLFQGGTHVNSLGSGYALVIFDSLSGQPLNNYQLTIDWNDVFDAFDEFPFPGDPTANPDTVFNTGSHQFFRTYPFGNPDKLNPANPIPVDGLFQFDPRLQGSTIVNGIQFFSNGTNVSQTTLRTFLTVPGEGLFGGIVVPESEIERISQLPESKEYIPPSAAAPISQSGEDDTVASTYEDESRVVGPQLFYTLILPDGSESEPIQLPIRFLDQNLIFEFFKQLPNNRYNVYYKEGAGEATQTLFQFNVLDHQLVPLEFKPQLDDDQAGETDSANPEMSLLLPKVEGTLAISDTTNQIGSEEYPEAEASENLEDNGMLVGEADLEATTHLPQGWEVEVPLASIDQFEQPEQSLGQTTFTGILGAVAMAPAANVIRGQIRQALEESRRRRGAEDVGVLRKLALSNRIAKRVEDRVRAQKAE